MVKWPLGFRKKWNLLNYTLLMGKTSLEIANWSYPLTVYLFYLLYKPMDRWKPIVANPNRKPCVTGLILIWNSLRKTALFIYLKEKMQTYEIFLAGKFYWHFKAVESFKWLFLAMPCSKVWPHADVRGSCPIIIADNRLGCLMDMMHIL